MILGRRSTDHPKMRLPLACVSACLAAATAITLGPITLQNAGQDALLARHCLYILSAVPGGNITDDFVFDLVPGISPPFSSLPCSFPFTVPCCCIQP